MGKNPSKQLLNDLCIRFVLNCPEEELRSVERMLFQVEQAYWFYEDTLREENPILNSMSLKEFIEQLFKHCTCLKAHMGKMKELYAKFTAYKAKVPVMGAIILDEDMEHCLMLRGMKASGTWGFPKGKVDQEEADIDCAAREVMEECSLDISEQIKEEDSIERHFSGDQRRKMYIVMGVHKDTPFQPKAKGEVGQYLWVPVSMMPATHEAETKGLASVEGKIHKFYKVAPFTKQLRKWIKAKRKQRKASLAGDTATSEPTHAVPPPPHERPLPSAAEFMSLSELEATALGAVVVEESGPGEDQSKPPEVATEAVTLRRPNAIRIASRGDPECEHPWSNFCFDKKALLGIMEQMVVL